MRFAFSRDDLFYSWSYPQRKKRGPHDPQRERTNKLFGIFLFSTIHAYVGDLFSFLFGYLLDLTGVRSSAFMLLYGVVWVSLIWMYWTEVRHTDVIDTPSAPILTAR